MRRWMQKVGGFSNTQLDPLFASENSRKYSQILGLFNKGSMGQSLLQHASPDSDGNFHTGLGKVKTFKSMVPYTGQAGHVRISSNIIEIR